MCKEKRMKNSGESNFRYTLLRAVGGQMNWWPSAGHHGSPHTVQIWLQIRHQIRQDPDTVVYFGLAPMGGPPMVHIVVTFPCAVRGVSKDTIEQAGSVKFRPIFGPPDRAWMCWICSASMGTQDTWLRPWSSDLVPDVTWHNTMQSNASNVTLSKATWHLVMLSDATRHLVM